MYFTTRLQFDDYDPVDKIILEKSHKINDCSVEVKKATPRNADMGAGHMMGGGGGGRGNVSCLDVCLSQFDSRIWHDISF